MILRLTEGDLAPAPCLLDEQNECERAGGCATLELYKRLDSAIRSVIDQMTLAELKEIQCQKNSSI